MRAALRGRQGGSLVAGREDDVVRAVMYLESAPFVTGEFLHVDGGQSAGH